MKSLPPAQKVEDTVIETVAVADGQQATDESADANDNPERASEAEKFPCKGEEENEAAK